MGVVFDGIGLIILILYVYIYTVYSIFCYSLGQNGSGFCLREWNGTGVKIHSRLIL